MEQPNSASPAVVKTDLLIVGAGPAGASLACFLGSHGHHGIMISAAPGTADTPRAHITNMAALECLRDIGLEEECIAAATHGDTMCHTRWCHSLSGEEYARCYSWGHHPNHKGNYETASPCSHADLPQTLLEPILTKRAVLDGWTLRFNTSFVRFIEQGPEINISEIKDDITGNIYHIQSRFVFGCDGARSQVVRELQLPLDKKPNQGLALNILVRADLTQLMKNRRGNLHWVLQPDKEHPPWGWSACVRMVKAWNEWMFIFLPAPGSDVPLEKMEASNEEYLRRVKEMIGDESIDAKILAVNKWWINEVVASQYSKDNVFCLGDAVHRHPPFNGLGSNTCIQDAFNLAWKVSYVLKEQAKPSLLATYGAERQPVGVQIITRANQGLRDHTGWMDAIGMTEPDLDKRKAILEEFERPDATGAKRRSDFHNGIANTNTEFHGLGVEMNQRYESTGVFSHDEALFPYDADQSTTNHVVCTYPGRRLPHVWLNTRAPTTPISTIDLAGHGAFCLLTGPQGQVWKEAAATVAEELKVPINAYSIGWKQDYEDVYFDWSRLGQIEEGGCVLVRPDRFVAWRSKDVVADPKDKLKHVIECVLSLS